MDIDIGQGITGEAPRKTVFSCLSTLNDRLCKVETALELIKPSLAKEQSVISNKPQMIIVALQDANDRLSLICDAVESL
jgi:hypothetical protein